nr:cardiolipin synthase [Kineosphaera limosa]
MPLFVETVVLVVDFTIKALAIGIVPENRRPSSSSAWLLLILFLPLVGLPLFLLLGSSRVNNRRHRIQAQANALLDDGLAHLPTVPPGLELPPGVESMMALNRRLTSLPCVPGTVEEVLTDYHGMLADIAAAIDGATRYVHVQTYIARWDEASDPVFAAMARARARGVEVRLLIDHLGSRRYRGYRRTKKRFKEAGFTWHLMLPIDLLRLRWRRLDLRNHRKVIVVDGRLGYVGSLNLIAPHYGTDVPGGTKREWLETVVRVSGPIVASLESVFAVDWYTECAELLDAQTYLPEAGSSPDLAIGGPVNALQVVPSGPGFQTQPNQRLFTSLIHRAQRELLIVSPYFVPDESILEAVTTAAHRGVRVELFVSERADQFVVQHAQASYYTVLLEAGVRIHRYPAPFVLHAKFLTVDDEVAVIGSSNMDMRSFGLNYEISLMGAAGDMPARLRRIAAAYRGPSAELSLADWETRPWLRRYTENVARLTSALQ